MRTAGGADRLLICVVDGNIYMPHGVIDRCSEGRATECRAQLAGAWDRYAGSGRVAVSPVRSVTTPGVPVPSASARARPCGAVSRALGADHAEDARECGARCAGLFGDQRLDTQRDRDARDHGLSRCRTRAWLSDGRDGITTKSNLITRSTVCLGPNFSQSTSCWFPIRSELSASVPG